MNKGLYALAIGTFALGIAEFGMMGVLGEVASGVGVSISEAGHLISAYSLGVAVGAPMLIVLRRMPLKRLMLLLSAVIFIGNLGVALSPGYVTLLCARFVSGLPHGAFFRCRGHSVCPSCREGSRRAGSGGACRRHDHSQSFRSAVGHVLYVIFFGWRVAFGIVATVGLLSLVCIRVWLPYLAPLPDSGIKGQFRFLRNAAPWLIYGGVFFGQASVYCWFSYIEPIMTRVTGFSTPSMSWVMVIAGAGMVVGNMLSGKLADRYKASVVTGCISAALVFVMAAVYLCVSMKVPSLILMFIATAGLFGIGGPLQYIIVRFAKGGEMLGGAGIQIAFNVSNAMSAALGGLAIQHGFGLASPALVGIPFAAVGAVMLFALSKRE